MNTTQSHESEPTTDAIVGENPPLPCGTVRKIRAMTEEERKRAKVREARNNNG